MERKQNVNVFLSPNVHAVLYFYNKVIVVVKVEGAIVLCISNLHVLFRCRHILLVFLGLDASDNG